MKKLICVLLLVVVLMGMLAACSTFTCDICEEEKSGDYYEVTILDETIKVCEDCYDLGNLLDY